MEKQFTLNPLFTSNMVFQANHPIVLFGSCKKGIRMHFQIEDAHQEMVTFETFFRVELNPRMYSNTPFAVKIYTEEQEYILDNCLSGDVFLLNGQSNIEFITKDALHIEKEELSLLRLYTVPKLPFQDAEIEFPEYYQNNPSWQEATSNSIDWFSAIGYLVGKGLIHELNQPIGLISCNMGDTSVFSWCKKESLVNPKLENYLNTYQKEVDKYSTTEEYNQFFHYQLPRLLGLYSEINKNVDAGLPAEKAHELAYEKYPDTYLPMGPKHYNRPGGCYETMLSKLEGIYLRGVVFYQGEQDHDKTDIYEIGMNTLFQNYRTLFSNPTLPIVFVQIPGYSYPGAKEGSVPSLRLAQSKCVNMNQNVSMVSGIDCGEENNIHPKDKIELAKRICNRLLYVIYHQEKETFEPEVIDVKVSGDDLILFIRSNSSIIPPLDQTDLMIGKKGEMSKSLDFDINDHQIKIHDGVKFDRIEYLFKPFSRNYIYNQSHLPLLPFVLNISNKNQQIVIKKE